MTSQGPAGAGAGGPSARFCNEPFSATPRAVRGVDTHVKPDRHRSLSHHEIHFAITLPLSSPRLACALTPALRRRAQGFPQCWPCRTSRQPSGPEPVGLCACRRRCSACLPRTASAIGGGRVKHIAVKGKPKRRGSVTSRHPAYLVSTGLASSRSSLSAQRQHGNRTMLIPAVQLTSSRFPARQSRCRRQHPVDYIWQRDGLVLQFCAMRPLRLRVLPR